jgi:hypothetical protein
MAFLEWGFEVGSGEGVGTGEGRAYIALGGAPNVQDIVDEKNDNQVFGIKISGS